MKSYVKPELQLVELVSEEHFLASCRYGACHDSKGRPIYITPHG